MTVWHQLTEDPSTWPEIGQTVCITTVYHDTLKAKYSMAVVKYVYSLNIKVGFSGSQLTWTTDALYHANSYWCLFPELNDPIEIQI
jgi:hypothetical protein